MELSATQCFRNSVVFITVCVVVASSLPTSLLEDTKAINVRTNKVKRTPEGTIFRNPQNHLGESNPGVPIPYYSNPSAKKRGGGIMKQNMDLNANFGGWDPENESVFERQQQEAALRNLSPELFANMDDEIDEKTLNEYQKGFLYGANKAKIDEQMENAVLKSELYGDPASINQYRYYGRDDKRRKRSGDSSKNKRIMNRYKRELELNPEDVLALLSLWEAEREHAKYDDYPSNSWPKIYNPQDLDMESDDIDRNDVDDPEENWLEAPVYPNAHNTGHFSHAPRVLAAPIVSSPYYYDTKGYQLPQAPPYAKRTWDGFAERNKRFMVSRKRSDPTRELRYFSGAPLKHSGHDDNIYTLAQLLGGTQQRDPNVPLYHRVML